MPGDEPQPVAAPIDEQVRSEPLDLDEGDDVVIEQHASGADAVRGGGEFPDRDAPPSDAAAGSLPEDQRRRQLGDEADDVTPGEAAESAGGPARQKQEPGSFREAYEQVDADEASSGSINRD